MDILVPILLTMIAYLLFRLLDVSGEIKQLLSSVGGSIERVATRSEEPLPPRY